MRDLNLTSLQDYPEFRPSDPSRADYFGRRVEYFQAAKAIRPELDLSMTSIYPDDLRNDTLINGETVRRLDWRRSGIYGAVAGWYFEVLRYYHDNGLSIDILNAVNEPDFITRRYGFGTDFALGSAEIFAQAIDSLEVILADPARNPTGVTRPLIMGPSTIGPAGAVTLINYYKNDRPDAWANIDIVSYHQYTAGTSTALQSVTRLADGKPVYQSEMHTNRGDDLPALASLSIGHRGILSLARTLSASVNAGANAWFYFLNVFLGEDTNPGLLQIDGTTTRPIPFRHYYAFRQLTSAQPAGSRVLTRQLASIRSDGEVLVFRRPGSDTVFVHYANFTSGPRAVELELRKDDASAYPIRQIGQRISDATRNDEEQGFVIVSADSSASRTVTAGAYSLNTFTVVIGGTSRLSPKPAAPAPFTAYRSGEELAVSLDAGAVARSVRLADLSGRVLRENSVAPGQQALRLTLGGLPQGEYLVSIRTAAGWATRRVAW